MPKFTHGHQALGGSTLPDDGFVDVDNEPMNAAHVGWYDAAGAQPAVGSLGGAPGGHRAPSGGLRSFQFEYLVLTDRGYNVISGIVEEMEGEGIFVALFSLVRAPSSLLVAGEPMRSGESRYVAHGAVVVLGDLVRRWDQREFRLVPL